MIHAVARTPAGAEGVVQHAMIVMTTIWSLGERTCR